MRVSWRRQAVTKAAALTTAIILVVDYSAHAEDSAPWDEQRARRAVAGQFSTKYCEVKFLLGMNSPYFFPSDKITEETDYMKEQKELLKALADIGVIKMTQNGDWPDIELRGDVKRDEISVTYVGGFGVACLKT